MPMEKKEEEGEAEERETEERSGHHMPLRGGVFYNTSIVLFIIAEYLQGKELDDFAAHDLLPEKLLVLFKIGRHKVMMACYMSWRGMLSTLAALHTRLHT